MFVKKIFHLKLYQKLIICLIVSIASVFVFVVPSFACSGVYVGSDVNDQGTSIISRSSDADILNVHSYLKVYGGDDGEKPELIRCNNGFEFSPGDVFYRFISTQNADCYCDNYWAFAINECGVSVSSPVSGYSGPRSLEYNAFVKDGLPEDPIAFIVGSSCKTAKEGIELIAKIINEKGSASDNIVQISDQNECWYLEIYGGHEYCAVKCPNDCVAAFGNEFQINDEYATCDDAVCSPHLFSRAQENHFAVYNADGKMNIWESYVGKGRRTDFSRMRTWGAHRLLSSSTAGTYSTNMELPLFYKPDKKVSVADVAEVYRDRYEGTEYCPETMQREDTRVIATEEQTKIHLLQTYKDVPADICALSWYCPNSSEFGDFIPLSNCETKFDKSYTKNALINEFDANNVSYTMKALNVLCDQNRKQTSKGVRVYWKALENYAMNILPALIKDNDKTKVNDFCNFMQKQSFEDSIRLYADVNWFLMNNTITQKNGIDLYKLEDVNRERQVYDGNIDVMLFAKIAGWKIDDFSIRKAPISNNDTRIDEPVDINQYRNEGYIKISKNNKSVEIITSNGNVPSVGKLNVNGSVKDFNANLTNDKIYAPFEILDVLYDGNINNFNDYTFVTDNNIKVDKNIGEIIGEWPLWIKIVSVVVLAVFALILLIIIIKTFSKKQR